MRESLFENQSNRQFTFRKCKDSNEIQVFNSGASTLATSLVTFGKNSTACINSTKNIFNLTDQRYKSNNDQQNLIGNESTKNKRENIRQSIVFGLDLLENDIQQTYFQTIELSQKQSVLFQQSQVVQLFPTGNEMGKKSIKKPQKDIKIKKITNISGFNIATLGIIKKIQQ